MVKVTLINIIAFASCSLFRGQGDMVILIVQMCVGHLI